MNTLSSKLLSSAVVMSALLAGGICSSSLLAAENKSVDEQQSQVSLNGEAIKNAIKPVPQSDNPGFEKLHKLLTVSSLAKKVQSSNSPSALTAYKKAIEQYNSAVNTKIRGEQNKFLNQARIAMFTAARAATPQQEMQSDRAVVYNNKKATLRSLRDALLRINSESSASNEMKETLAHIDELEDKADALAEQNKYSEALEPLEQAFLMVKSSVQNLRQGKTLVRSLNFASKKEEYEYELDRNHTHFMLLKMLIDKKKNLSDYSKRQITTLRARAEQLAKQAEKLAANNDYPLAVETLEESTKQLVRAIRMGGVFIPG